MPIYQFCVRTLCIRRSTSKILIPLTSCTKRFKIPSILTLFRASRSPKSHKFRPFVPHAHIDFVPPSPSHNAISISDLVHIFQGPPLASSWPKSPLPPLRVTFRTLNRGKPLPLPILT